MNLESHPSWLITASREMPSSNIKINLDRLACAASTVRLRTIDCSCSRSDSVRFILPMTRIGPQKGCYFNDSVD